MESMHQQDIRDTLLLCDTARKTIVAVMERNADKGEPGRWRTQTASAHMNHAREHIESPPLIEVLPIFHKHREDLEHALVRLAMALIKLEEEHG